MPGPAAAVACAAGAYQCSGALLQTCADDLTSWVTVQPPPATRTRTGRRPIAVRVCNGTSAGVQNCPNGRTNGRGCNHCSGNGVQCINGNTIRRCAGRFFQDTFCQLGCNQGATTCQFFDCVGGFLVNPGISCPEGTSCDDNAGCVPFG